MSDLPELTGWARWLVPAVLFGWAGFLASIGRWFHGQSFAVRFFVLDVLVSQLAGFGALFAVASLTGIYPGIAAGMFVAHMGPRGVFVMERWALRQLGGNGDQT